MKKLLVSTILSLGIAMPSVAAVVEPGDTLAANQNYTYWLLDAIKSMDPQINTDVEGSGIMRSLFEGLINEDQAAHWFPASPRVMNFQTTRRHTRSSCVTMPNGRWRSGHGE